MMFEFKRNKIGYDFDLENEMNVEEKFDDVVIKYVKEGSDVKKWSLLKEKKLKKESDRKKINDKDLIKKKDGILSLKKYFI